MLSQPSSMDLDTDDELLQRLSDGQSMDHDQWPGLLSRIISRLEKIVHDDFPSAPLPPETVPSFTSQTTAGDTSSQTSTTSTNKENDPPPAVSLPPGTLPPQIQLVLSSIYTTLSTLFQSHPPHTIQRLAELILNPKQHYRNLPSYLHAVDRVVHVTSGAHIFPLPPAISDPSSAALLLNGTSASGIDPLSVSWGNPATGPLAAGLGSDEALGGALLTPITWLSTKNGVHSPLEGEVKTESTEMIDGPNGLGGVETVTVSVNGISSTRRSSITTLERSTAASIRAEGGVLQGELLRQEQRAGVVPVAHLENIGGESNDMGEDDELPHARGPEEIGMEDMGPQTLSSSSERMAPAMSIQAIDVEAAVGRKLASTDEAHEGADHGNASMEDAVEPATPKREAEEELGGKEKKLKEEVKDEKVEIVEADGKVEDEKKIGDVENKGANAIDTISI